MIVDPIDGEGHDAFMARLGAATARMLRKLADELERGGAEVPTYDVTRRGRTPVLASITNRIIGFSGPAVTTERVRIRRHDYPATVDLDITITTNDYGPERAKRPKEQW